MVKNAPTTAIRDVMSSSKISVSFMCRLRNKEPSPFRRGGPVPDRHTLK